LRFPGFSGEWKEFKLGDIVDRVTRRNKTLETNRPLTISAQYGLIDQIDFFKKTVASQDLSNYYLLFNGEFAYNKSYSSEYPWGAVKRLDLYDKGALSSLYICFKPKDTIESDYLVHYFASPKWHQGVANIAGEGARNHGLLNIAIQDYFNTIHYIPKDVEQRKIGDFLNIIEERIQIQNKVIEDLKKLKTALEEKCISGNNGRLTRLGDILEERIEKSTQNNQYEVLSSTVNGIFSQKEYFNKEIASTDNTGYKVIRRGDIVFSPQNLWMGNINYNDRFEIGIVSPSYKIFSIKAGFDSRYIAFMLKTKRALWEYSLVSEQGASIVRRNLNLDSFLEIGFFIPSPKEQKEIGDTISLVKEKLLLEQRFLKGLNRQKQSLLSNLFI
jgi:type I restriction enzyme S subunit